MSTATNPLPWRGQHPAKREIFAAMALQGIMTRPTGGTFNADAAVREAIQVAEKLVTACGPETRNTKTAEGGADGGG